MTAEQLTFGDQLIAQQGLCNYGTPQLGEARRCSEPATHAAVCHQRAYRCGPDSPTCPHTQSAGPTIERPEHTARIECCRDHADYYASAWAWGSVRLYPDSCRSRAESTWIEQLPRSTTA